MSSMEATSTAVATVRLAPVAPDGADSASELPALLVPPSGDAQADAIIVLLMVQGQDRDQAIQNGREDLQRLKGKIQEALAQVKAALHKAAKAQHKSGFWGKLGKKLGTAGRWAAVGVSVAVAVGTLGAAAPVAALAIAGAVLSTAGACQGQWHVMEKAGVSEKTAFWTGLGISAAGVLCTAGASYLNATESAVEGAKAAKEAASTAKEAANAANELEKVAHMAKYAAAAGAGCALAGEGVCEAERGLYDRRAGYAEADAQQARADQARAQRLIQWVLEHMEDTEHQHERKVRVGAETISSHNESMMLAATRA